MNEMLGLTPAMQQLNSSPTKSNVNKSESQGKGFLHSLKEILNDQSGKESLQELLSEFGGEIIDPQAIVDLLGELITEIPFEEGYLKEIMLQLDESQQLLDLFPKDVQLAIEELFQSEIPIEELIEAENLTDDPLHIVALLMALNYHEKESGLSFKQDQIQNVRQMLSTVFPIMQSENNFSSVREMTEKLANNLEKFLKGDQSVQQRNGGAEEWLRRLTQQMNEKRIAEQAYQQHLAQRDSTKPVAGLSMNLDMSNNHMSRLQQFVVHAGEQQADRPSEQQFLRQFQNILARSQFQNLGNGIQQLNIQLHPQSLGRLDITIQQINGVLVAKMMTTTAVARDLIEGQLQHLRNAFQTQQIQVDRIEVTQQQSSQQNSLKDQTNDESANHEEPSKDDQNKDEPSEEESFADFLEETINMEV
ncbi:flagellar hook-length control protein FliK [Bacillus shivajii]|uniref:flagellar hook-length control protein FliK n=1 Tax=Bacillus shivajii TaxID=1983719 RepID=UPI001CF98F16|nr:flagellar hook-length control protein FliK [Bacillus shivajii]UCZ51722.1 flagellar hook-length control protein FliK [Bacillus shivajii]